MKFVSLLSGGKDSCFNVIKCIEHGHELVCVANLAPPDVFEGEDMNSFMYQTAGHIAVPYLAECFDVPIVRQVIHGTAVTQKLDYLGEVAHDEVEDLFVLLQTVKEQFPEVEGVSCGAIVSTYQRLRVENICQRLGLTVLSYLWMRDRVALLDEMVNAGLNAVLVKVAGAGLEPERHLGKSLAVLQPTLLRLHGQFGLDVCGEGGEYESLVLDCSAFKKRLQLLETEVVIDEENYTVGYLKIKRCVCVDKQASNYTPSVQNANLQLLRELQPILTRAAGFPSDPTAPSTMAGALCSVAAGVRAGEVEVTALLQSEVQVAIGSDGFGQTSLVYPRPPLVQSQTNSSSGDNGNAATAEAAQAQMADVLSQVQAALQREGVSLQDTVFVHLYIRSSAIFKAVNDDYCKWFGPYPPSRSCVCAPLPEGVHVCMDAIFLKESHARVLREGRSPQRSVLHVKSMSGWAPLCIGPYAQANTLHEALVCVAGQIPLVPATMGLFDAMTALELLPAEDFAVLAGSLSLTGAEVLSFVAQLALCLRHAHRVLQATGSSLSRTLLCTVYVNLSALSVAARTGLSEASVQLLTRALITVMEEADREKAGAAAAASAGASAGAGGAGWGSRYFNPSDDEDEVGESESPQLREVPVLVVFTSGLPRDAVVEAEVVGFVNNAIPAELFQYRTHCGDGASGGQDGADEAAAERRMAAVVDAWPVWPNSTENSAAVTDCPAPEPTVTVPVDCGLRTSSSVTQLPRSLCVGFVRVEQAQGTASAHDVDIDAAVVVLTAAVRQLLCVSQLHRVFLRSIRVYYQPTLFDQGKLHSALASHLQAHFGATALLLVPMLGLDWPGCGEEGGAAVSSMVLAAQVLAVDTAQLGTDEWIHVKE